MPKINLLSRKQRLIERRREAGSVWLISKSQNDRNYFVKEVKDTNFAVIWTPHMTKAMVFHTKTGVEHFIHNNMKNRKDLALVKARRFGP